MHYRIAVRKADAAFHVWMEHPCCLNQALLDDAVVEARERLATVRENPEALRELLLSAPPRKG